MAGPCCSLHARPSSLPTGATPRDTSMPPRLTMERSSRTARGHCRTTLATQQNRLRPAVLVCGTMLRLSLTLLVRARGAAMAQRSLRRRGLGCPTTAVLPVRQERRGAAALTDRAVMLVLAAPAQRRPARVAVVKTASVFPSPTRTQGNAERQERRAQRVARPRSALLQGPACAHRRAARTGAAMRRTAVRHRARLFAVRPARCATRAR